ncbi:PAS domain-containing protein [Rhodovastum atsumiense]|uniref:PAS domain-containing protein n=1 Tax=Rhodovastum atsumiense TaxID=504468 RepID=A0A5M6IYP2_9PROT|nr:PAS domain-containing protein [Rhodovastum atsumiense]KAA5613401.1 PAS domain-containing protein [Rhodovastum atsumiense]CAH2603112.1 PAS domain-containing protein [Rhodovastum atsumiense]
MRPRIGYGGRTPRHDGKTAGRRRRQPPGDLFDKALSTLSELFSADIVALLDPAGTGTMAPLAAIGLPEDSVSLPMSDAAEGHLATVMRTQAPVLVDAAADARVEAQLRALGVEAMVWLPMPGSHDIRGALLLAPPRGRLECLAADGFEPVAPDSMAAWTEFAERLRAAMTGESWSSRDVRAAARGLGVALPAATPLLAGFAVTLGGEGQSAGLLLGLRRAAAPFSSGALQAAALYAGQVAASLENARLYGAVRDSHERFRALVRSVSDVIAILAADGTIQYASPAAEALWAVPPEQLRGQTLLQRVHPEDAAAARDLLAGVRAQAGCTMTQALRLRRECGTWRDFS